MRTDLIRIGAEVKEGDILIGKITPKGETDPSPEEKLLRAIFGDKAGDVKDASMKAPPSTKGVVINKKLFARAVKDKKAKGSEKAVLENIAKEEGKELADLKNLLVEKLMELIGGENSAGVFNKYKEEQVKQGREIQRQSAGESGLSSPWIPPTGPATKRPTNWFAS
jgi:DNA-directed RNA polymerase subunit beta